MLTLFQSLVLGLVQGVTELFPISSLGHSVILPTLLGWNINQTDPAFVTFIVVTHLATALVLLAFFARDWWQIIAGMWRSVVEREIRSDNVSGKIGWLLVVSSIPAGLLGILFEKQLSALFAYPFYAGIFLIGNGILLYATELFIHKRQGTEEVFGLSFPKALGIGFMQSLALFPGFSRTGASLAGSVLAGLTRENAARYAFLLATPIIFAAALLKIPKLSLSGESVDLASFGIGALAAGMGAYFSIRFLTRYFKANTLTPFALYCVLIGFIAVLVILH